MNKLWMALGTGLLLTVGTTVAHAQSDGNEPDATDDAPAEVDQHETTTTDEPAATAQAKPTVIGAPPPAPSASIACTFAADGVDTASARTAAGMICDEIRARGVFVGQPSQSAGGAGSTYHVMLRRLGRNVVLELSFQSPIGRTKRTRRLILKGVEEAPVAAPRVAASLLDNTPLQDTQRVDNLVGEETRTYEKKSGEFLWGGGIQGMFGPGPLLAPGFEVTGFYETPEFGVGMTLRHASGENEAGEAFATTFGIGGRYFLSSGDISPFAGGGLALMFVGYEKNRDDGYYADGDNGGLGAYAEVGVEFLRLRSTRLTLGLRADAPFYAQKYRKYAPLAETTIERSYFLPISFSINYSW